MLVCRDRFWGSDKYFLRYFGVFGFRGVDLGGLYAGCGLVGVGCVVLRDVGGRGERWFGVVGVVRSDWVGVVYVFC